MKKKKKKEKKKKKKKRKRKRKKKKGRVDQYSQTLKERDLSTRKKKCDVIITLKTREIDEIVSRECVIWEEGMDGFLV